MSLSSDTLVNEGHWERQVETSEQPTPVLPEQPLFQYRRSWLTLAPVLEPSSASFQAVFLGLENDLMESVEGFLLLNPAHVQEDAWAPRRN